MAARLRLIGARLARDESGATAIEYGLIISCLFLVIVGALQYFAAQNSAKYAMIGSVIGNATH